MIIGIGTDILKLSDICPDNLSENDPFFKKTYSLEEIRQGMKRSDSINYFSVRFSAKEAVFKCLGTSPERIYLNEISIIDDENGQPHVNLTGDLLNVASKKNIDEILISMSCTSDYVISYAIAQSTNKF